MRICLISRYFSEGTHQHALAAFVHDFALGLQKTGHEVAIISLSDNKLDQCIANEKVSVYRVGWKNLLTNERMLSTVMPYTHHLIEPAMAIWQKFRELNEITPFDVVEVQGALAEALFVGFTRAAPLLVRLHGPLFEFGSDRLIKATSDFDGDFIGFMEKFTVTLADHLICSNEQTAKGISSMLNYPLNKIAVASDALEIARASVDSLEPFKHQQVAQQATYLYEHVINSYGNKKRFALYQKPVDSLLPSVIEMITAFNLMLYNSLYVYSWRFRLNHWIHKAKNRPRLYFAKAILRTISGIFYLTGRERLPGPFNWLEEQIQLRESNGTF